ncbi:uncharacterized protein [Rutidosis leptorrhynchoides]|uniref:uncharacterized protein n=1 Tax=Rutidosis leptorrhynchoides TaxID=125765 RepID=UPI003A9A1D87
MPKERRSSSLDRCRVSPYSRGYNNAEKKKPRAPTLPVGDENEWEDARCPICMEHPHNAVLLLCASREKGCRPYMCDTSSRHSNCLDQFQKSSTDEEQQTKLACPLCRGQINGWIVVNPARKFMDSKTRSCSLETCDFTGNYSQLRKHARCEHPRVRPTDVDPERELEWRNLEDDLERQDMFNMQFGFDDDDDGDDFDDDDIEEFMDSEFASPLEYDLDFMHFFSSFESGFDDVYYDDDLAVENSIFLDNWDDMFNFSLLHDLDNREYGRSRGPVRTDNRLSTGPREHGPSTRRRNGTTHRRSRSNNQPSSRNRQEQVTTLVDFHELSSNLP